PQATRTLNSDEAFNPDANFGENYAVQVNVATNRLQVVLTGSAEIGEKWVLTLTVVDNDATQRRKLQDYVFEHTVVAGDTLATIAATLRTQIENFVDLGDTSINFTTSNLPG